MREIVDQLAAHDLLHHIIEGVPLRIFWKDRDGRYIGCNTLFAQDAGFDAPETLIGKSDADLLWRNEAGRTRDEEQQIIASGEAVLESERPMPTNAGGIHWLRVSKMPLHDDAGEVCGILGIYKDITEQKQMEDNLKLAWFVSDHAPESIAWIDRDARFRYVNEALCRELGYSREALLQMSVPDVDPDTSAAGWPAHWQELQQQGSLSFETRHRRADGTIFPVEVLANFVRYGEHEYNIAFARNISSRRQFEEELQQESRLRGKLLEYAAEGITLWRPSNDARFAEFLVWNRRMQEITGYTMEEINRTGWLQAIYLDEAKRERARQRMQAVLDGAVNRGTEFEIVTKSGEPRVLTISSAPVEGFADEVCVLAVIQDITQRRRQQEQLEASRQRFSTLFDSSSDGMFILNMQGRFIEINRTAHERLGYSRDEMMRMSITELDSPEYAARVPERLAMLMANGEAVFETAHRRKDGTVMPVEINARLIELDGEQVFFSMVRDISERKELEEQLRQSQKMEAVGTLVGGIAHDFNNMLAAMQGNLFLARQELHDHPLADERLANIELLGERAAAMVQQLLTFARKDEVVMHVFSLNALLKEAYQLNRNAVPANIDYRLSLCDAELSIRGDATQLQQMLMNLVKNAADAVSEAVRPQIHCILAPYAPDAAFQRRHPQLKEEAYACITVQDNGHGIEEEHLEKIFEPFFTTKEVGKGTGLGLATLYGGVQSHGGTVELESHPGAGTTFRLYLPLCSDAQRVTEERSLKGLPGHGETILLVDDEESLRQVGHTVFTKMGYRVIEAVDGVEALELIRSGSEQVALVVTDVIMPRMGGMELLRELRSLDAKLPVILVTGYDKDHVLGGMAEDPYCSVANKPFHFGDLSETIRRLLDAVDA